LSRLVNDTNRFHIALSLRTKYVRLYRRPLRATYRRSRGADAATGITSSYILHSLKWSGGALGSTRADGSCAGLWPMVPVKRILIKRPVPPVTKKSLSAVLNNTLASMRLPTPNSDPSQAIRKIKSHNRTNHSVKARLFVVNDRLRPLTDCPGQPSPNERKLIASPFPSPDSCNGHDKKHV
jgi:hypothetical protein